jgi:hypothetical protein
MIRNNNNKSKRSLVKVVVRYLSCTIGMLQSQSLSRTPTLSFLVKFWPSFHFPSKIPSVAMFLERTTMHRCQPLLGCLDNLSVAARHILVIGSHNNKMTCCSVVARQDDYFWGVMVVFVHVFADEITRKENPRIRLPRLHKAPFSSEGRVRCFSLFQIISSSRSRD